MNISDKLSERLKTNKDLFSKKKEVSRIKSSSQQDFLTDAEDEPKESNNQKENDDKVVFFSE